MTELLAWIWAPAVLYALLLGLGLLADGVLRTELPGGLLAPVGLALAVVVVTSVYRFGGTAAVAAPLTITGALVGFSSSRVSHLARQVDQRAGGGSEGEAVLGAAVGGWGGGGCGGSSRPASDARPEATRRAPSRARGHRFPTTLRRSDGSAERPACRPGSRRTAAHPPEAPRVRLGKRLGKGDGVVFARCGGGSRPWSVRRSGAVPRSRCLVAVRPPRRLLDLPVREPPKRDARPSLAEVFHQSRLWHPIRGALPQEAID